MPILRESSGLPRRHDAIATTRSTSGSIAAFRTRRFCATASRAARSGRHVSRSDRSASRLVPIVAHDQHRAEQSRALQDLRHARLRGRCGRQEDFQIEQLRASRWMPAISSANMAPISFGCGPAASITRMTFRFRRKCSRAWATHIAGSGTRCAFCWGIFMIFLWRRPDRRNQQSAARRCYNA